MKKAFVAFVFVLIASSYIYAEKITAEIVESQTLQNNPSIAKAKHDLYIAKQALYSSFSSFLPIINFSVSLAEQDEGFVGIIDNEQYSYGLAAKVSLFSGFSQYNTTRALSAKLKAAEAVSIAL